MRVNCVFVFCVYGAIGAADQRRNHQSVISIQGRRIGPNQDVDQARSEGRSAENEDSYAPLLSNQRA